MTGASQLPSCGDELAFARQRASTLGQQNKEEGEKAPLCLGLNARPAREEGFSRLGTGQPS